MNRHRVLAMFVLLTSSSLAIAQAPAPPAELAKFDRLVGSWEGKGVTLVSPEGPEVEWTAISVVSKPLGGYVIQDDTRVDVGEALPAPILFRTLHAWDAHRRRFVTYEMSNVAPATCGTEEWVNDARLVATSSNSMEGVRSITHSVADFGEDGYRFEVYQSRGGEPFFAQIKGSMRKSDKTLPPIKETADMTIAPPPSEMGAMRPQCGTWRLEGRYRPAPGMEMMSVTGVEELRPILGGHVLLGVIRGDPAPGSPVTYREHSYLAWSAEENAYLGISHSNFGMTGHSLGYRQEGGVLVYTGQAVQEGTPAVHRLVRSAGPEGKTLEVTLDAMRGTAPAERLFEGSFRKVAGKED